MLDLKTMRSALEQLEEERGIPKEKIIGAIEDALVAAYKKDYGKKGQIIRATFDLSTGQAEFYQVKIVVDESMLKQASETDEAGEATSENALPVGEEKVFFNEEHHIMLDDARKMKGDVRVGEELIFPLENKEDYGRIAAQTAKQVIIQRLREAEKTSIIQEYGDKEGQIISGKVQKMERGNVFIDLGRTTAILPREEQVMGEYYRQGERIKAYLYSVMETPQGVNLKLSRSHPKFVEKLFAMEAPEMASGAVEIKAIAREAGARTKMAVASNDPNIDAVGSCVGQRGVRVNTVISELGGEKIDIIEWTDNMESFIANALSPAKINKVTLIAEEQRAIIEVDADQFSLAVGKGGQNVRLAAKLTGWKIDIVSPNGEKAPEAVPTTSEESAPITS
jgi:N utilization substance protein A